MLRRQLRRNFRKPLIVIAPKKLLKLKEAGSKFESFGPGTKFSRTIKEREESKLVTPDKIRKLVFCSGQVYYDLKAYRDLNKINDVAIITVEQLFPLPYDHFQRHVAKYPNAQIIWTQEEHKNMGGWSYVQPRFNSFLKKYFPTRKSEISYAGRSPCASTATGFGSTHKEELESLIATTLK